MKDSSEKTKYNSFPLIYGKESERLKVISVRSKKLKELGIIEGTEIILIQKNFSGLSVQVKDSKYCLDKNTAAGIKVQVVEK